VTLSLQWFFTSDELPAEATSGSPKRGGPRITAETGTLGSPADTLLVECIRTGDTLAFDRLFLDYYQRLWVFAYELTSSRDHAEEVVQDVFTTIWTRRTEWEVLHGIAAYLFGAVRNRIYKERRHGAIVRRVADRVLGGDTLPAHGSPPADPAESATTADLLARLEVAIARMPIGRRTALLLRWREQLTYDEIARIMGTSSKAVSFQLSRAREELRPLLEK
jgi:RNA polymerase sigma factor (sigma-70 family)